MSIFLCARCDELRDSDDGCEEYKRTQLICMDCISDMEDAEQEYAMHGAEMMEKAMGPDHSKSGIFVYHRCAYCDDGRLPCRQGAPNRCDNPRARND